MAALTNNFKVPSQDSKESKEREKGGSKNKGLWVWFDDVIESAKVGLRKPDPRIYELTCKTLGVAPSEVGLPLSPSF